MDNETRRAIEAYASRCTEAATSSLTKEIKRLHTVLEEQDKYIEELKAERSYMSLVNILRAKDEELAQMREELYHAQNGGEPCPIIEFNQVPMEKPEPVIYLVHLQSKGHEILDPDEEDGPIPKGFHVVLADEDGWIKNPGNGECPLPDGTPCELKLVSGEWAGNAPELFAWGKDWGTGAHAITHYRPVFENDWED